MKKKAKEKGNMTVSWASVHSELFFFAAPSTKLPPSFLKGFYLRSSTTSAPIIRSSKTEKKNIHLWCTKIYGFDLPPPPPSNIRIPLKIGVGIHFSLKNVHVILVFLRLWVGGRSKIWMFLKIVGFPSKSSINK